MTLADLRFALVICVAVRLSAVLPWFALFFGLTSTILTLVASKRATAATNTAAPYPAASGQELKLREKEEASVEQREIV